MDNKIMLDLNNGGSKTEPCNVNSAKKLNAIYFLEVFDL